eukprot:5951197-Prymnesium_polylepis.2
MAWRWSISMPFSPRTARGYNPRCVEPARAPRGPREAMACRWLETGIVRLRVALRCLEGPPRLEHALVVHGDERVDVVEVDVRLWNHLERDLDPVVRALVHLALDGVAEHVHSLPTGVDLLGGGVGLDHQRLQLGLEFDLMRLVSRASVRKYVTEIESTTMSNRPQLHSSHCFWRSAHAATAEACLVLVAVEYFCTKSCPQWGAMT